MATPAPHRTLIVANLTAATPFLLQEVARRASERQTTFSLLIPNVNPAKASDWTLQSAVKLLQRAAGGPVEGSLGGADAFTRRAHACPTPGPGISGSGLKR